MVRLLSKGEKKSAAELAQRHWMPMEPGCGCEGRYTPVGAKVEEILSAKEAAAIAWGDKPKGPATYEAWLRERVSSVSETEINCQLGELTVIQATALQT